MISALLLALASCSAAEVEDPEWTPEIQRQLNDYFKDYKSLLNGSHDIRVSKAHGSHGYNAVRLSLIDNHTGVNKFFTYNERFRYRWDDHNRTLHSALKQGLQAGTNTFDIGTGNVSIHMPQEGTGIRGIIMGDPCLGFGISGSDCNQKWLPGNRTWMLLNAAAKSLDFWAMLGDLLYDNRATSSQFLFDHLSLELKSKFLITVPGNNEYWDQGEPGKESLEDQKGYGYVQWYGQDTAISKKDPVKFIDFSKDPNQKDKSGHYNLADSDNFFSYYIIGDIGFITYSGAASYPASMFQEACASFDKPSVQWIYLLGHWVSADHGGVKGMDVPTVHASVLHYRGCNKGNVRYMTGHSHANQKWHDCGSIFGGGGMYDRHHGNPNFGIGYIDTRNKRHQLIHWLIADNSHDNYQKLLACFNQHREDIVQCASLGEVWVDMKVNATYGDSMFPPNGCDGRPVALL